MSAPINVLSSGLARLFVKHRGAYANALLGLLGLAIVIAWCLRLIVNNVVAVSASGALFTILWGISGIIAQPRTIPPVLSAELAGINELLASIGATYTSSLQVLGIAIGASLGVYLAHPFGIDEKGVPLSPIYDMRLISLVIFASVVVAWVYGRRETGKIRASYVQSRIPDIATLRREINEWERIWAERESTDSSYAAAMSRTRWRMLDELDSIGKLCIAAVAVVDAQATTPITSADLPPVPNSHTPS